MAPPINDDLADARVVTGDDAFTGETTVDATYEAVEYAEGFPYPSVWYRLEWPAAGRYTIAVANASDGYYFVARKPTSDPPADFSETVYGGASLYKPSGADGEVSTPRYGAGTVRYIYFITSAFDGSFVGNYDISFDFDPGSGGPPPANDDVADAVDLLTSGLTDSASGTTVDATVEEGFEDNDYNGWFSPSVWYHIQPSEGGRLILQATKTGGTTDWVPEADVWHLPTYPPSNADDWEFIGYAGDGTATPPATNIWPLEAGEHYLISVEDYNYDNAQEGDFDLDLRLIPSPLVESWEGASIDPDIWVRRIQTGSPGDPNTGPWSLDSTYSVLGTKSIKEHPTTNTRHQLIYMDVAEGGDLDRDYWIAFKFFIEDWNDVLTSDTGQVRLPGTLAAGSSYPDGGSNLVTQWGDCFLYYDTSTTGYLEDVTGGDWYLSAGVWHELRTRYRKQSSNNKVRNTQILDGVTIVNDVEGGFLQVPQGIAWTSEQNFGGGAAAVWIDPIVWSPDTDPGELAPSNFISGPFIASSTTLHAPTLAGSGVTDLIVPFLDPTTVVFDATLAPASIFAPFIAPGTTVFAAYLSGPQDVLAPFIDPTTTLYDPFLLGPDRVRVSQEPVEALLLPTDAKGRLTQEPVEALILPTDAKVRATQAVVEVLVLVTSAKLRFSQDVVEVLILPTDAKVRETQAIVEVLRRTQKGSVFIDVVD